MLVGPTLAEVLERSLACPALRLVVGNRGVALVFGLM